MKNLRVSWIMAAMLGIVVLGAMASRSAVAGSAEPPAAKTAAAPPAAHMMHAAIAKLESAEAPKVSGLVTFAQDGDKVRIVADVTGVDKPGPHGFHLHENGKCEHDPAGKHFSTAGGHFNPTGVAHACPDSAVHHAGDFGNIDVKADGTGHLELTTSMLSLTGANTPVGKAVILHTGDDDCKTQPTGNAGGRLACGVVIAPEPMHH
jgi:Cu-Zn family superoxide dismutase